MCRPLPQVVGPLVLSCVVGVCMSHAAYMLRDAVSATLFTIVGILCKVGEGAVNGGWAPALWVAWHPVSHPHPVQGGQGAVADKTV